MANEKENEIRTIKEAHRVANSSDACVKKSDPTCHESGSVLLKTVVELTGLPDDLITQELNSLLEKNGLSSKNLTLDQLRIVLLEYLETLQEELLSESNVDPRMN